jgi:hypothetical protein
VRMWSVYHNNLRMRHGGETEWVSAFVLRVRVTSNIYHSDMTIHTAEHDGLNWRVISNRARAWVYTYMN